MRAHAVAAITAALLVTISLTVSAQPEAKEAAQEKFLLQHVYAPGEYRLVLNSSTTQTSKLPDGRQHVLRMNNDMTILLKAGVVKANGEREFTIRYESYKVDVDLGPNILRFDSANPTDEGQDPNLALIGRALMSMNVIARIDADGEATSLSGSDEVWDKLATDNPGNPWVSELRQGLGIEFYNNLCKPAKGVFKDTPVAVGEAWQNTLDEKLPVLGMVKMTYDAAFKKLETTENQGPVALVEFKGGFAITEARDIVSGNGMPTKVTSAEYTYDAALRCDIDKKLIVAGMNNVKGVIKVTITLPNEQQMPVESAQDTTVQLTCERVEEPLD